MGSSPEQPVYEPTSDDRMWGLLAHLSGLVASSLAGLSFLGPLIVYLIKKDQSPFVADQAKEALNFQISVLIVAIISAVTCVGPFVVIIGGLVYSIIAAMAANKGEYYRYPYTFRLIK